MKKFSKAFFPVILLVMVSIHMSARPNDPEKDLGVFIDGKLFSFDRDTLSITTKGILSVRYSDGSSLKANLTIRVLIRHRNYAGNVLLFPWDEEYRPAKPFSELELPDLLKKMKHGDQLVLMPMYGTPIVITVTSNNC